MNAFVGLCMDCIDARDLKIVIPPTDRGHSSGIGGVRRGIPGVVHDHPESLSTWLEYALDQVLIRARPVESKVGIPDHIVRGSMLA